MAGTISERNTDAQNFAAFITPGTGGALGGHITNVRAVVVAMPASASSTATGGLLSWINPESTTIAVVDVVFFMTTTGTSGTMDVGVSLNGTGTGTDMLLGATMALTSAFGVRVGGRGNAPEQIWMIGPQHGTGSNSIVGQTSELNSTAVGFAIVQYVPLAS